MVVFNSAIREELQLYNPGSKLNISNGTLTATPRLFLFFFSFFFSNTVSGLTVRLFNGEDCDLLKDLTSKKKSRLSKWYSVQL
jgi:hypothetical protein